MAGIRSTAAAAMSKNYDFNSFIQMTAGQRHVSHLVEALRVVDRPSNLLTVADFGSATGLNSMKTLSAAMKVFRESSNSPLQVYHCDRPGNHWSVLFNNALTSTHSYLSIPNTFVAGVGRSFYDRLFPANSVSVAYTNYSLHWLSAHSKAENQFEKYAKNDLDFHAELRAQSTKDLDTFLTHRAAELIPGGRLVLHMLSGELSHRAKYAALKEMEYEGLISHKPLQRLAVHVYPTTAEEVAKSVDKQSAFRLISLQPMDIYDGLYQKYLTDGDAAAFGKGAVRQKKVITESIFLELFRDEDGDVKELVDSFYRKTAEWYRNNPEPLITQEVDAIVEKVA